MTDFNTGAVHEAHGIQKRILCTLFFNTDIAPIIRLSGSSCRKMASAIASISEKTLFI